jgi:hypothetical protein
LSSHETGRRSKDGGDGKAAQWRRELRRRLRFLLAGRRFRRRRERDAAFGLKASRSSWPPCMRVRAARHARRAARGLPGPTRSRAWARRTAATEHPKAGPVHRGVSWASVHRLNVRTPRGRRGRSARTTRRARRRRLAGHAQFVYPVSKLRNSKKCQLS